MDWQRSHDLAMLISMLALPVGCVDRGTVGSTSAGEAGDPGDTAASQGGETASSAGSSAIGESTTADAPDTRGGNDASAGPSTTGGPPTLCEAHGEKMAECFPELFTVEEATTDCILYIQEFSVHGPECLEAVEVFFLCEIAAECRDLNPGDPCLGEQSIVQYFCSGSTDS